MVVSRTGPRSQPRLLSIPLAGSIDLGVCGICILCIFIGYQIPHPIKIQRREGRSLPGGNVNIPPNLPHLVSLLRVFSKKFFEVNNRPNLQSLNWRSDKCRN